MDAAREIALDLLPGAYPFWSRDGKGVIYMQPGKVMFKDADSVAPPPLLWRNCKERSRSLRRHFPVMGNTSRASAAWARPRSLLTRTTIR